MNEILLVYLLGLVVLVCSDLFVQPWGLSYLMILWIPFPCNFFFFFLLNKYFIAQPEKGEKQKNWAKFHLYSKPAKSKKADLRWESA